MKKQTRQKIVAIKVSESSFKIFLYKFQKMKFVVGSVEIYKNSYTQFRYDVVVRFNSKKLPKYFSNVKISEHETDIAESLYELLFNARQTNY